jgi:methylmalonyl-CoA/ethylmalonyl-CoA epimerase
MKLHHIGYIVKDISTYEKHLLYEEKIKEIIDPVQNSKLALYKNYSSNFIELIQPINVQSFNYNFLEKYGEQYHHLCYSVDSKQEMEDFSNRLKMIFIQGPLPAILFDNKEVYFYYSRNKTIIEFLIQ